MSCLCTAEFLQSVGASAKLRRQAAKLGCTSYITMSLIVNHLSILGPIITSSLGQNMICRRSHRVLQRKGKHVGVERFHPGRCTSATIPGPKEANTKTNQDMHKSEHAYSMDPDKCSHSFKSPGTSAKWSYNVPDIRWMIIIFDIMDSQKDGRISISNN